MGKPTSRRSTGSLPRPSPGASGVAGSASGKMLPDLELLALDGADEEAVSMATCLRVTVVLVELLLAPSAAPSSTSSSSLPATSMEPD